MKKLSILLMLFASMLSLHAEIKTGNCGTNVTYTLDTETGVLTISGSGPMKNFSYDPYSPTAPWGPFFSQITSAIIEDGVTSIGRCSFKQCVSLTSVTIPESVTDIDDYAFWKCSSLTSLSIPNSVTSIGEEAFWDCSSLTSVAIPNSVTSIEERVFKGCSSLTSVSIPNSVTSIGKSAFYDCSGLTSVTIPNSVTSIGDYAFCGCSGLTSVTIPNSVTSIGDRVFVDCYFTSDKFIDNSSLNYSSRWGFTLIDEDTTEGILIKNSSVIGCRKWATSVTIPNSVTSIGEKAFLDCSNLTSVTIPNSVTSIEEEAFYDCSSLTSLTIPNSVTSIEERVFGYCSSLTSIAIPNSVTSIGDYAFCGCSGLTSVTIPNSVTRIGYYAFSGCSSLTSITIPNSVTSIEDGAFECCSSLTSIAIPNSVTSIEDRVFQKCSSLTSITIPNSVTSIGVKSFAYCKLESIILPKSITTIHGGAFYDNPLRAIHFKGFLPDSYANLFSECAPNLLEMSLADPVPPTLDKDFFKNTKYRSGTLYVPDKAVEAYSSTLPWYAWGEIHPLSELKLDEENTGNDIDELKKAYATLKSNYENASKELENYKRGDLNGDGVTNIGDVETLIKLNTYSSSEMALTYLVEETGITLTEIADLYGNVEFYILDGKQVSKPTQSGVYIIKKNGETKMIVVKK